MAEGFIRQRGNAWQVIVHAGRDPVTGKRRNLTGTARTKREAQALRARLLNEANEGRRPATDANLGQLLERWLELGLQTRLHDLRHYAATQLIAGGGATTLRVYTHFMAAADRRAAEVLEQTLRRPSRSSPGG
jgi:integrase